MISKKKMMSEETMAEKATGKLKPLDDEELTGIVGGPGNNDDNNDYDFSFEALAAALGINIDDGPVCPGGD